MGFGCIYFPLFFIYKSLLAICYGGLVLVSDLKEGLDYIYLYSLPI